VPTLPGTTARARCTPPRAPPAIRAPAWLRRRRSACSRHLRGRRPPLRSLGLPRG
ncbi:hypothetical protein MNEG_13811, partial [Monoraphidium neglectum]